MSDNTIKAFFAEHHRARKDKWGRWGVNTPLVRCADGFTMSVQASAFHNCSPKEYLRDGAYSMWEIGYPSKIDSMIERHAEHTENPVIFSWVPTDLVNLLIAKHGGLASVKRRAKAPTVRTRAA